MQRLWRWCKNINILVIDWFTHHTQRMHWCQWSRFSPFPCKFVDRGIVSRVHIFSINSVFLENMLNILILTAIIMLLSCQEQDTLNIVKLLLNPFSYLYMEKNQTIELSKYIFENGIFNNQCMFILISKFIQSFSYFHVMSKAIVQLLTWSLQTHVTRVIHFSIFVSKSLICVSLMSLQNSNAIWEA